MLFSKSCAKIIDLFPNKARREGTLPTLENVTVYNRHPVHVATSLSSKPIRYTTLPPTVKERTKFNMLDMDFMLRLIKKDVPSLKGAVAGSLNGEPYIWFVDEKVNAPTTVL